MAAPLTRTLTTALRSSTLADVYSEVAKAHATRKLARRVKWRGCDISIEQDRGQSRKGVDADGHAWETVMQHPYGYFRAGQDNTGEHHDVFLNEHDGWEDCPVHVVHQVRAGQPHLYDEDKIFVGWENEKSAKAAYLANYDKKGHELFGAMSVMTPEALETHIKGGKENWGRPLVHGARQKIMLRSRQVEKAQAAVAERIEWMRGVVAVAKAGGPGDEREEHEAEVTKALAPVLLAEQAMAESSVAVITDIEKAADGGEGRRLMRVTPSFEAIDLQNQLTTKDVIREAWPYYEQAGNFDLEHLTKKGGQTYTDYLGLIEKAGFRVPEGMDEIAGRNYFEIGRPVKDSFDAETCTYVVEVYKGHPVADWFWHTLTEVSPPWPWKCSIGGAAKLVEVVAENPEPIFGKGRTQKFEVLRQFRWNNTAGTLEPVQNYCPPVEVLRGEASISKGIDAVLEQETPMTNTPMQKASDVLKDALMEKAQAILADMHDSGQMSSGEVLSFTAEIAKALEPIEGECEVVKALDYGTVTTDSAGLTDGGAFTREGLSTRRIKRMARELYEDYQAGETPIGKSAWSWSDDPVVDVAEYVQEDLDLDDDEALGVASAFFTVVSAG